MKHKYIHYIIDDEFNLRDCGESNRNERYQTLTELEAVALGNALRDHNRLFNVLEYGLSMAYSGSHMTIETYEKLATIILQRNFYLEIPDNGYS